MLHLRKRNSLLQEEILILISLINSTKIKTQNILKEGQIVFKTVKITTFQVIMFAIKPRYDAPDR